MTRQGGFALLLSGLMLLATSGCASNASAGEPQRETYVFCNVFLGVACFGIASGDELKMTIPADYVRYDVKIGTGIEGIVYYGYNPSVVDPGLVDEYEKCLSTENPCRFVRESKDRIEAIYSSSRKQSVVHVILDGINASNRKRATEFLGNFRQCDGNSVEVICSDEAVFLIAEQ